jgi:hypothetical protein
MNGEAKPTDEAVLLRAMLAAGGPLHEFNNILGSILGYTHLALEDLAPDHPAHASIAQVAKAGLRARELLAQVLAGDGSDQAPSS